MRAALIAVSLLAGCGGSPAAPALQPTPQPPAPVGELSPALAPLAWWPGHWLGSGGTEHWVAASGAIYGVGFDHGGNFEVLIVDDAEGGGPSDGVLRLFAMPGGKLQVEFKQAAIGEGSATFANPAHDDPKSIQYARTATGLAAHLQGESDLKFNYTPIAYAAAPDLEQADLAFSAATKASGVDGWLAAFAPDGWMWRKGGVVVRDEIRELMAPLLASGTLAWAPVASGTEGALGYTIGKATFTGKTPDDSWRSTYVTIWKQQPDGSWKVLFDTGRGVNEK